MPRKTNNDRLYPRSKQPKHIAETRKKDSLQRQADYDLLPLEDKIVRLPPAPGAKKQRTRLLALLEKQNANVSTKEISDTVKQTKKQK
jgi:hypothetical protein